MIKVHYSSIDYFHKTRTFKTLAGARKFAVKYVGENPDMGSSYAVSFDGVGKIEVDGCSLEELFYGKKADAGPLPFEVWSWLIDEQGGNHCNVKDGAYATLWEAQQHASQLEEYADGVSIIGATDEARAELKALFDRIQAEWKRDNEPYPF